MYKFYISCCLFTYLLFLSYSTYLLFIVLHTFTVLHCNMKKWNKWRARFQNLLHPLVHVTHLQLRSQQRSQFSTQNLLQMQNVDTNWNFPLLITLCTLWNTSNESNPQYKHILWDLNYFNCKRKSIMQMRNMSEVDVRGFRNKLFKYWIELNWIELNWW